MSIDAQRIEQHLDDYEQVTGKRTELFVCPVTLRECKPSELIDGHILNASLARASRRCIAQYGKVDHFYGSTVEPDLVRFLNLKEKKGAKRLRRRKLRALWADGSEAKAFLADSRSGRNAAGHYPQIEVPIDGEPIHLYLKIEPDDPRVASPPVEIVAPFSFSRLHWIAAMMKAAHLAMFDLIGYRSIFDPFGDTLRRTLAKFFEEDGALSDSHRYFSDFRNSIKILGIGKEHENLRTDYRAFDFDTLEDRLVFLHHTPSRVLFAATCIFKINGASICVTLPHSMSDGNVAVAWSVYSRLMDDESSVEQFVHQARFQDGHWQVVKEPQGFEYVCLPNS